MFMPLACVKEGGYNRDVLSHFSGLVVLEIYQSWKFLVVNNKK